MARKKEKKSWYRSAILVFALALSVFLFMPMSASAQTAYGKIAFNAGGGIGTMSTQTITGTQTQYMIPDSSFVRPGYRFTGWKSTTGESYAAGDVITVNSSSTEVLGLVAQWAPESNAQPPISSQDGYYYVTLLAGESILLKDIPAGVAYQVWEETPDGWSLAEQHDESGRIVPLETQEASFFNEYTPGITSAQISGVKTLDGNPAEAGAFSFTLYKNDSPIQTVSTIDGGFFTFDTLVFRETDIGTHIYTIREVDPRDNSITWDQHVETVTIEVFERDGNLSKTITYDGDGVKFENSTKPSGLQITKKVKGGTAQNANTVFNFRVTLFHANGLPFGVETPITWKLQSSSRTNVTLPTSVGVYDLSCKAGETIIIRDLPGGTRYVVEEYNIPSEWTLDSSTSTQGTLSANRTSTATFTNAYSAAGQIALIARKAFEGDTTRAGQFNFELLDSKGAVIEAATNMGPDLEVTDGVGEANPYYGLASVHFTPLSFTQADIGKTYTYKIREIAGTDPSILYDDHEETVRVSIADAGNGSLNITAEYDADGAVFTNSKTSGSLKLEKTISFYTEEAKETAFPFTITLKDPRGHVINGEYEAVVTKPVYDEETGEMTGTEDNTIIVKSGKSFELIGSSSIIIEGLPHGATFEITEDVLNGWELVKKVGENGTIEAGAMQEASFENAYATKGEVVLGSTKQVHGKEMTADTYRFALLNADNVTLQTVFADAQGNITFAPIDFTGEDNGKVYYYYIKEVEGEDETVIYDTKVIEAKVEIKDNGLGEMEAIVTYDDESGFDNYILHELTLTKTVGGNMGDKAERFTFFVRFYNEEGEPVSDSAYIKNLPETWSESDGVFKVALSHGETTSILVRAGVSFVVEEQESDYEVERSVSDKAGNPLNNSETDALKAGGIMSRDMKVDYTNTKNILVPTKAPTPALTVGIGIAAVMLAGLAVLVIARRKRTIGQN